MAEWTDSRHKSFIISALRSATRRYPPRYETLREAATEKKINAKTGRLAQHYKCSHCLCDFPAKDVQVNHKIPVVDPAVGWVSWDEYVSRMFCKKEHLEVLCVPCHKQVTAVENSLRKEMKGTNEATKSRAKRK